MTINELCKKAHENAKNKGFWEINRSWGELIALVHSELSEALEEARYKYSVNEVYYEDDGKPCGIPIELADACIRIFDICGAHGIDLEKAIEEKMKYNENRPYKHGKAF